MEKKFTTWNITATHDELTNMIFAMLSQLFQEKYGEEKYIEYLEKYLQKYQEGRKNEN